MRTCGADDPHAIALFDYAHGRYDGTFCYLRDDGHAAPYEISYRFASEPQFSPQDRFLTEQATGRVLDVGCGSGKHVAALRERGLAAVGVDREPLASAAARHFYSLHHVALMDAFALGFADQAFDSVTLYSNGLSMGGSPDGVAALLRELARVTRSGGRLLSANTDVATSPHEHDQRYQRANLVAGRPRGLIRMCCRYAKEQGDWFNWLFVAPSDLAELIRSTPWNIEWTRGFVAGAYVASLRKN